MGEGGCLGVSLAIARDADKGIKCCKKEGGCQGDRLGSAKGGWVSRE